MPFPLAVVSLPSPYALLPRPPSEKRSMFDRISCIWREVESGVLELDSAGVGGCAPAIPSIATPELASSASL